MAYSSGNEVHLAQKRPPSFKRSRGGHRQRQAYRQHVNQRVFIGQLLSPQRDGKQHISKDRERVKAGLWCIRGTKRPGHKGLGTMVVETKDGHSEGIKEPSFGWRVTISRRLTNSKILSFQFSWGREGKVTNRHVDPNIICGGPRQGEVSVNLANLSLITSPWGKWILSPAGCMLCRSQIPP